MTPPLIAVLQRMQSHVFAESGGEMMADNQSSRHSFSVNYAVIAAGKLITRHFWG
jgi:hypothetical protein